MIQKIVTKNAPNAIGPYSQAVIAGDYMFISGQIAINPLTGNLVEGGVKEQTKQVMENIKAILAEKAIGFDKIIKAEVYLLDLGDFQEMNEVYELNFINEIKPARQAMQVSKLPLNSKVEISAIVYLGGKK